MKLPAWLPLPLLAALAVAIVWGISEMHRAEDAEWGAQHLREQSVLDAQGFQRAQEDLTGKLAKSNAMVNELTAALNAKHIPSSPVVIVSGTTGPIQAGGAGLTNPPPSSPGVVQAPAPVSPAGAGCLLTSADQGEIRVSGGAVETDAGNAVVTGRADAYALNPERRLFGGPLKLQVHIPSPQPLATQQGMGIGWAASGGADRVRTGPVVALPTFSALWLRWDASVNVQCELSGLRNGVCAKDERGRSTLTLGAQIIGRRK